MKKLNIDPIKLSFDDEIDNLNKTKELIFISFQKVLAKIDFENEHAKN